MDGTRIATAGHCERAAIWDANTGGQLREIGGGIRPYWVAFSEDGTRLVCADDRASIISIWDVASGKSISIDEPFQRFQREHAVRAVCFSLDNHIFSASDDYTIHIWHTETRAIETLRMDGLVMCIALSPDGKRLVTGSLTGKIALWDAETGAAIPMPFVEQDYEVKSVAFSPDGRMIASVYNRAIILWDATGY